MGHEVHVTRGAAFGSAGANPISQEEWTAQVQAHPEIVPLRGPTMARLGGRPLIFGAGLISSASPGVAELKVLRALATTLGARMFGEDGTELGLSTTTEVARIVAAGFPKVDVACLSDAIARDLTLVTDPSAEIEARREALTNCTQLDGAPAIAALAYLLCRAIESGGQPEPALTCAAAHLLRHHSKLLDGLRKDPTKAWVTELERLAPQVEKSPGPYVIRSCHSCSAKNRLPVFPPPDKQPKCGRCKTLLAAPG